MRPRVLAPALALTLAAAALAASPAAAAPHSPPPLVPVTTDQYQPLPEEDFFVPTRGGDVYVQLLRPDVPAGVTVPVILTYTPYAALGGSPDDGTGSFFVPKGYARAVAHVVGTGNSGGCWDYGGPAEQASAYDLVEYLGTQPWSNGKVGMIGGSYDGTTANMAAVANPPHLATIVPEVAIAHWYGYAYFGGVHYFLMDPAQRQGAVINEEGFDTPLGFDFGFGLVPPTDPDTDPNYATHVSERPCPDVKAEHTAEGYSLEPDYTQFWQDRDYAKDGANLAVPDGQQITVLVQGGWRDYNVKHSESTLMYESVPVRSRRGGRDGVPYKMLVMGQGAHGGVDPEIGFSTILHAWFDRWLYGYSTGIERQAPVISKTNDGVVHADRSWPPPRTRDVSLYLHPGQSLSTAAPGTDEGSESYRDTGLMTESQALQLIGQPGNGQVLWYMSQPLAQDVRVSGRPSLDLFASSDATSTHFTPVLFDLGPPVTTTASLCTFEPAQEACTMSRGFLNARYRDGLEQGKDLVPGEPYRASVDFVDNDWVVKAGHRIGVAVMSSNTWWALDDQLRAQNTIFHDAASPSALVLPIVGGPAAAAAAGL